MRHFITGAADMLRSARDYRQYLVAKMVVHDAGGDHPEYEHHDTLYTAYKDALTVFDALMGPLDEENMR